MEALLAALVSFASFLALFVVSMFAALVMVAFVVFAAFVRESLHLEMVKYVA